MATPFFRRSSKDIAQSAPITRRQSSESFRRPHIHMSAFRPLCYALYHLTRASLSLSSSPRGFPPRTKNRHVRRKYIAHVGAVTKDVSANLPRKGNFLHFSPRTSIELGARGKFSPLKYRGNQSPARVVAIAALFSALFPALGREVMG